VVHVRYDCVRSTKRLLVFTDVSEQAIGLVFKSHLRMGPIGCPETSRQNATDWLYSNVGNLATSQRYVTSQKNEDLNCTAVED